MPSYAQTYREPPADRLYVCAGCCTPQHGPAQGGAVTCSQCHAQTMLPDRGAMLASPPQVAMPSNDPARLAQLRVQDGQARTVSPSLVSVLGGPRIQAGREQEALLVWNSLRARAAQGDVAASEDLASLTVLLTQLPSQQGQPDFDRALYESAFDVSVLPRHKQQHLGNLTRNALLRGDRASAERYLSWMSPNAAELDADSQFRLSSAVAATMDRDPQRVLALLGAQKDAVPIADSMDDMACVFRANAYEVMGNFAGAQAALGQLSSAAILPMVRQVYASLDLCARSAGGYTAQQTKASAARAGSMAGMILMLVGGILIPTGLFLIAVGVFVGFMSGNPWNGGAIINGVLGVGLIGGGATLLLKGRAKGKHAAWLAVNGLSLEARITGAQMTGTRINNVPLIQFNLQVSGPQGPYAASFRRTVPDYQVAQLVGQTVRVRANPQKLEDLIVEEG